VNSARKAGAGSVAVGGMLTSQTKPTSAQDAYARGYAAAYAAAVRIGGGGGKAQGAQVVRAM
jgi:hypothetical protein